MNPSYGTSQPEYDEAEAEPEGYYPEYYPEYYDEEDESLEYAEAKTRDDPRRSNASSLPFSFVLPLGGGGGIAPALTVPIGGANSPFSFALPLSGTTPPQSGGAASVSTFDPLATPLGDLGGLEETITHTADLSNGFFAALRTVAAALQTQPHFLMGVMNAESGIRASAHNPNGHASGLIQFMPATLSRLGWTQGHEAFRRLTADEQMPFVHRYYLPFVRQGLNSTARLYQATFLPATLSRGSEPDTVIVDVNNNDNAFAYAPNRGLDRRGDGRILVGDLTAFVERAKGSARWREALERLQATAPGPVPPIPPIPPVPTPTTSHPILRRGARGEPVREAQTKLNIVHSRNLASGHPGLRSAPLTVDGIFGVNTYNAVVSFQQQAFPSAPPEWDGVIGPKTWAKLDAATGNIMPQPQPQPQPVLAEPAPIEGLAETQMSRRPILRRGARGDAVREAQTKLNTVHNRNLASGRPGLRSAPLTVDGIFGVNTYNAVVSFQQQAFPSAPPEWDGVIGPKTWAKLDAASSGSGGGTPLPVPPSGSALTTLETRYFPPTGVADSAPFTRTPAATIVPQIDGVAYFRAVKAEIDKLQAGDIWYITGWWLDQNFRFTPAGSPTLGELLANRAAAGVDVRVIIWASRALLGIPALAKRFGLGGLLNVTQGNVLAAEALRALPGPVLAGRVLLDWSGNLASSHHMKLNILSRGDKLTAFAGGIDYKQDRLDGPPHNPSGWHDAAIRVTGYPAQRVLDTFVTRWTECSTLSAATYDIGSGPKQFNPAPILPLTARTFPAVATPSADTSVQVVRSFPNSKEPPNIPWSTLPRNGVHEVLLTFRTALQAARRYIYVEDQFFNATDSLFPLLVDACKRNVKVIAVVPGTPDPADGASGPVNQTLSNEVRAGILAHLTPAEQKNLAVWRLNNITVHSKIVLIDDEFLCIGSANFMDRSMQFTTRGDDSELSVAAVSVGSIVSDLRVQLWAEHLRVSDPSALVEIRDLSKSLGFWRSTWGSGVSFPHPSTALAFVGPP